jgi:hypothetical protein
MIAYRVGPLHAAGQGRQCFVQVGHAALAAPVGDARELVRRRGGEAARQFAMARAQNADAEGRAA